MIPVDLIMMSFYEAFLLYVHYMSENVRTWAKRLNQSNTNPSVVRTSAILSPRTTQDPVPGDSEGPSERAEGG
jgi:hypothetical protein